MNKSQLFAHFFILVKNRDDHHARSRLIFLLFVGGGGGKYTKIVSMHRYTIYSRYKR